MALMTPSPGSVTAMNALRDIASAVLSKGVISRGWYSILTGIAMLFVVWLIVPVRDTDPAVPFVAAALAVTGIWSLGRGLLFQYRRREDG
jgi:DMSO reductase anchor subunit